MATIYKYFPGFLDAWKAVLDQPLEADLGLIDSLFGRDELSHESTPEEVKEEALRQLEIEWRNGVDERAMFLSAQIKLIGRSNP